MRIVALRTLREFWTEHADAEEALRAWHTDVRHADWRSPADIIAVYANASILPGNRVVFNIRRNNYRLVVHVHYSSAVLLIRFVGTHAEYDRIDADTI